MKVGHLFSTGGSFEGKLDLVNIRRGSIFVKLKCRVMRPIETEVKMGFAKIQLEGKEKEREATVRALDESEQLRKDAINELRERAGGDKKSGGTRGEAEAAPDRIN